MSNPTQVVSANDIIQQSKSFTNQQSSFDELLSDVPNLLFSTLELILSEFNYEQNKHSNIAMAIRTLAVLTNQFENKGA